MGLVHHVLGVSISADSVLQSRLLIAGSNQVQLVLYPSLGIRPSHAEEEEGPVNLHTYKFEVRGISAG